MLIIDVFGAVDVVVGLRGYGSNSSGGLVIRILEAATHFAIGPLLPNLRPECLDPAWLRVSSS